MMKQLTLLLALVLVCGLFVAGCDKPKDPKDPAVPAGTSTPDPTTPPAPPAPNPEDKTKAQIDMLRGQLEDLLTKRSSINETVSNLQGFLDCLGEVDLLKDQIGALQAKIPALDNQYLNIVKQTGLLKNMPTDKLAGLSSIKSLLDDNTDLTNMLKSLSGLQNKLRAANTSDNPIERAAAALIQKQLAAEQTKVTTARNAIVTEAATDLVSEQTTKATATKAEAAAAKEELAQLQIAQAKAAAAQTNIDKAQAELAIQDKAIANLEAKLAELE